MKHAVVFVLGCMLWVMSSSPTQAHTPARLPRATSRVTLFASAATIERLWPRDRREFVDLKGHYCSRGGYHLERDSDQCSYMPGGINVSVHYDRLRAVAFWMTAYSNGDKMGNRDPASPRYWRFMVSLLPTGAKQSKCGTVNPSDQGGPAKVCLYHYPIPNPFNETMCSIKKKHCPTTDTIIVAQYLHPDDGGDNGHVQIDDLNMGLNAVHG